MVLRKYLGSQVPWPELAAVLGITIESQALPIKVDCPLCDGGQLAVYEDTIKGGSWHHCSSCQHQGDLIDLAAAVWNMPMDACLEKLQRLGMPLPDVSPEQVERHLVSNARASDFHEFWKAAKARLTRHRSGEINALRSRFRLGWRGEQDRWDAGPGRLLGTAKARAINSLFYPKNHLSPPSGNGVFTGRGWDEVLTVAYHDVPERIAGFFFIGRKGTRRDMVWRRVPRPLRLNDYASRASNEFGLAGLPLAVDSTGPVVCLNDPLLAVRLQIRQAVSSNKPLPIVAWHQDRAGDTKSAWRALAGRQLIFWNWQLTSRLVRKAVAMDGLLCTIGPQRPDDRKTMNHYLRLESAEDLYHRVVRLALPWPEFLSRKIMEGTDGWCDGLFLQLQREGADIDAIIAALRQKARWRLGNVLTRPAAERTAFLGNYRFIERQRAWHAVLIQQPNSRPRVMQISNFIFRIDTVVLKDNEPHYRGRLFYSDDRVDFELPQDVLERGCMRTLRRIFYQAGHTAHLWTRDDLWSRKLFPIALAFGPILHHGPGAPQWPAETTTGPETTP